MNGLGAGGANPMYGKQSPAGPSSNIVRIAVQAYYNSAANLQINSELDTKLLNGRRPNNGAKYPLKGDRLTVFVTAPSQVSMWAGKQPGHVGVIVWKSDNGVHISAGIDAAGVVGADMVTVGDGVRGHVDFDTWYFTKKINDAECGKLLAKISSIYGASKKAPYASAPFRIYGSAADAQSCVSMTDEILRELGYATSMGIAQLLLLPAFYARSFTRANWFISVARGHKHV